MRRAERIIVIATLGLALVLGTMLRMRDERFLHGDETASFLASACQMRALSDVLSKGTPPVGKWVPARTWQRFMQPSQALCFGEISRGLVEEDIHPPLYFWLLHLVLLVREGMLTAPLWLNGAFAMLTGAGLYALGVRLLARPVAAALAVLVFAVNPRTLEASNQARPYQLYALVTVWFTFALVRDVQRSGQRGWRDALPIAAASCLGLLTHYQFVIVALAGGVYHLAALGFRKCLAGSLGIAAGLLGSNLVHPTFRAMLGAKLPRVEEPRAAVSAGRVLNETGEFVSHALRGFAAQPMTRGLAIVATAALLVAVAAAVFVRWRAREPVDARFLVVPALIVVQMALLQRFGLTPAHVGGPRYLSVVQPLLALLPAYVVAAAPERTRELAAATLVGLLAVVGAFRSVKPREDVFARRVKALGAECPRVVSPSTERLGTLTLALALPSDAKLLVGRPRAIEDGLRALGKRPVCLWEVRRLKEAQEFLERRGTRVQTDIASDFQLSRRPKR
jgi:hypothetical protein